VVGEVNKNMLRPTPMGPVPAQPQHRDSLLCIENDAVGEEPQVGWELMPGVTIIEKVSLPEPTGFDPPDRFDVFLDIIRSGIAYTTNVRTSRCHESASSPPRDLPSKRPGMEDEP
jgi:hypothetical protein